MTPGDVISLLILLLLFGAATVIAGKAIHRARVRKAAPRETAWAQVTAIERYLPSQRRKHNLFGKYLVCFRLADGRNLFLNVPEAECERLLEGDTGTLTWKGTQYLFFSRR